MKQVLLTSLLFVLNYSLGRCQFTNLFPFSSTPATSSSNPFQDWTAVQKVSSPFSSTTPSLLSMNTVVQLADNTNRLNAGVLFCNTALNVQNCTRWAMQFDYYTGLGANPGDGFAVIFQQGLPNTNNSFQNFYLGIDPTMPAILTDGIKLAINGGNLNNCSSTISAPFMSVYQGAGFLQCANTYSATNPTTLRTDSWNTLLVEFNNAATATTAVLNVYINGTLQFSFPTTPLTFTNGLFGLSASTPGVGYDGYWFRNIHIYTDKPPANYAIAGASPMQICPSETAQLYNNSSITLPSGSFTYQWTDNAGALPSTVAQTTTSPNAVFTAPTNKTGSNAYYAYSLNIANVNYPNCSYRSNPVTLTVLPTSTGGSITPTSYACAPNYIGSFAFNPATAGSYTWNYGDGSPTDGNGIHTFAAPTSDSSVYPITLRLVGSNGCADTSTYRLAIYKQGVPTITTQIPFLCVGKAFVNTATATTHGSTISQWTWDMGDGTAPIISATNQVYFSNNYQYVVNRTSFNVSTYFTTTQNCQSATSTATYNLSLAPNVELMSSTIANSPAYSAGFCDNTTGRGYPQIATVYPIDSNRTSYTYSWLETGGLPISSNYANYFPADCASPPNCAVLQTTIPSNTSGYTVQVTNNSSGCDATSNNIQIVSYTPPVVSLTNSPGAPYCLGKQQTYAGSITNASVYPSSYAIVNKWLRDGLDQQALTPTLQSDQGGLYVYKSTINNGCTDSAYMQINAVAPPTKPVIASSRSLDFCVGDVVNVILSVSSPTSGIGGLPLNYSWEQGLRTLPSIPSTIVSTNPTLTVLAADTYRVTVTDQSSGCSSFPTDTIVYVNPLPSARFSISHGSTNLCSNITLSVIDSSTIAASVNNNQIASETFFWQYPLNSPSLPINNPLYGAEYSYRYSSFSNPASLPYTVRLDVISNKNCVGSASTTINLLGIPSIASVVMPTPCKTADSVTLPTPIITGPTGTGLYSGTGVLRDRFFPPLGQVGSNNITYSYFANNGCSVDKTQSLTVLGLPTVSVSPSVSIRKGSTVILDGIAVNIDPNDPIVNYAWTPNLYLDDSSKLRPFVSYIPAPITYKIVATSAKGGCQSSDSTKITFSQLPVIPNAFSPNGDGINDTWTIPNLNAYFNARVEIYNRNGTQVFSSFGYATEWNGYFNGSVLPAGVYFYKIDLKDDTPVYKGTITLIR